MVANGGGITITDGSLSLGRVAVVDNSGGDRRDRGARFARVSLRQSTVGRNTSEADGGGIALAGESTLEAINATVAENSTAGLGGGLFVDAGAEARAERGHGRRQQRRALEAGSSSPRALGDPR